VLGVLFLLQTAPPQACADPAPCRTLELAAEANRKWGVASGGYRAQVETESAMLTRREGRMEAATLVEQSSGVARWLNESGFDYHVTGSRSLIGTVPLSRLAFLRVGWIVPWIAGPRVILITQTAAGETEYAETIVGSVMAPAIVVHPLAPDRDTYYRFEGGQPAQRRIDLIDREVLVVDVIPKSDFTGEQTVFEGELDLDPQTYGVVRMVGRFRILGKPRRGGMLKMPDFEPSLTLVDLINQRLPSGEWVPLMQRFEIQNASKREAGSGAARRVISRFHQVERIAGRGGEVAIGASTMGYQVSRATGDSLRHFRGWYTPLGRATQAVSEADFSRYRPAHLAPEGKPLLLLQGYERKDFIRINRIEGYFTGLALMLRLRRAAPGVFAHAKGGYAWKEETFRGGAKVGWQSSRWLLEADAARTLDVTNKFRNQFDSRALSALVGRDAWDYLDRRNAGVSVTRSLQAHGSIFRLEGARVEDDSVERHMVRSPFAKGLRPNRGITPGTYWRGKALLDWNPEVSPLYAHDGLGFRAEVEHGSGDLDYTRVEARVVLRKTLTKMFFIARLHGGAVFSDAPPPQQLFEIGGPAGLPGYDYKEFAGDRAALLRMRLTYPFSFLDLPVRVSSRLTLPALAPAISLGFQGGVTDTRNAAGDAAVSALGLKYDYKTGEIVTDTLTGDPRPASIVSNKLRTSLDLRIGFFGDALAVGLAKPLEKGRKTRFIFAFGRQF
jgi:hypothetical protein